MHGNIILDTRDATTKHGIEIAGSTNVTVIDNRILNATGTGTFGIVDSSNSKSINCIDSIIDGYVLAVSGCDVDLRNDKL